MRGDIKRAVPVSLLVGVVVFLLIFSGFSALATDQIMGIKRFALYTGPEYVPDQVLVKFKPGVSAKGIEEVNLEYGTVVKKIDLGKIYRMRIPRKATVEEIIEKLKNDPAVEYVEPNYIAHAFMVPDDPYYIYQWNLDNSEYGGIHMERAWDIQSGGPSVVVAVVDTGIAYENYGRRYRKAPDLANTNFVPGYDFVNNDSHPNDDDSHGTHVAGTIAQSTNNGIGAAGIAFKISLMPVKVLDRNGDGTYADVAEGIRWAVDHDAKVINLSLGGSEPSQTLEDAVAYAYNKGVTIIAAAGNESSASIAYPAAYDRYVIAVGAIQYDNKLAPYSNYGPSLDLVAPGGNLNLDQNGDGYGDGVLQNTFNPNTKNPKDFGYWFFEGTSMAAPHVSGVAALLIANGNATTPDEVRSSLQSTARDLGEAGPDETYGWGLIDAYAALQWRGEHDTTPPAKVEGVSITTVSSSQLDISWIANSEQDLDHYNIYRSTSSGFIPSQDNLVASVDTNFYSDTGLVPSTPYYYRITAVDRAGNEGSYSDEASGITEASSFIMHVGSIQMDYSKKYAGPKNVFVWAIATVAISDRTGQAVEGATVYGHWSGAASDSDSGVTDGNGVVMLNSDRVKNPSPGVTFTFMVDKVTKEGWSYDPTIGETSDSITISGTEGDLFPDDKIPGRFNLYQNYPNPFNPETTIEYDIAEDCYVILKIYNLAGELIKTLVDGYQAAGHYSVIWHGDNDAGQEVASGVYFYRLNAGDKVAIKKMVLLK